MHPIVRAPDSRLFALTLLKFSVTRPPSWVKSLPLDRFRFDFRTHRSLRLLLSLSNFAR